MDPQRRTCVPQVDRWLGLSTNMIVMACGGLTYTYAVYSGHLEDVLHYSKEQMNNVGAAKDFGAILGIVSGVFYSYYPPWVTISIGGILHIFGYCMVWMALTGVVKPSFWLLCTYFTLGVGGDSFIDTACIITTLESFGDYRGTAIGLLKAQVGLSGAMFVLIFEAFIGPDVNQFVLLGALAPSVAAFLFAYFARSFPREYEDDDGEDVKQRFRLTYGLLICLGIFLMVVITINAVFHPGRAVLWFYLTIVLLFASTMFTIPLMRRPVDFFSNYLAFDGADNVAEEHSLPDFSRGSSLYRKKRPFRPQLEDIHEEEELAALKSDSVNAEGNGGDDDDVMVLGEKTRESSMTSSLLGLDFWLIQVVTMIGGGTRIAIINNFVWIGQALGDFKVNVYVGLISIWSCFGCILGGYGSDFLINRRIPRLLGLFMAQVLMGSCCLLPVIGWVPFLYIGSCIVGMAYGSHWNLLPPILIEVFGIQKFSTLYKINSVAMPIGAYMLSFQAMGMVYDQ